MPDNICKFIFQKYDENDLYPLHLVLETHAQKFEKRRVLAHYRMHYVLSETAVFYTTNNRFLLKKGDIFFYFTSSPYGLDSLDDFSYCYIGFTGTKATKLMNKLNINENNFIFHGFENDREIWTTPLTFSAEAIKLYSEGLLLCSFAKIAELQNAFSSDNLSEISVKMKKFIDENFNNPNLSLDLIAKQFSYNKKYLSKIFNQEFHITFSNYLCNIRVQNACSLMEKGFDGIQDIAYLCGFSDSLYFSKTFKKIMGYSPRQHLQLIKSQKKNNADKPQS